MEHKRALYPLLSAFWFFGLTIFMLYPLSLKLSTYARETGDTLLNTWILAWVTRSLVTDPFHLFHGNIFYPFPYSVAFSEVLAGDIPIAAPVLWLTGNPLLAHNVVLLMSFFLSGFGTYLLVRFLTGSEVAAILGGTIFAFAPYRFAHLCGHVQILTTQWMPLSLFFLHRAFVSGLWRDFFLFSACFILQALSCFYYAFYFGLGVALFVTYFLATAWKETGWDRVRKFAVACVVVGICVVPFGLPYFEAQEEYGFTRTIEEAKFYSAHLVDYLLPPPENHLYGRWISRLLRILPGAEKWYRQCGVEHWLFPGIVAPLLGLVGLLSFPRIENGTLTVEGQREPSVWLHWKAGATRNQGYYLLLAVFALVMSFGPELQIAGRQTGVPLPYRCFYELVPGFKALRCPARFEALLMLALAVLAGYGVRKILGGLSRLSTGWGACAALSGGLIGLVVLEYLSIPVPVVRVPTGPEVPPVYRWLGQQEQSTVVAELPADIEHNFWYMYFSTYHWRRIVNGYSGFVPDQFFDIQERLGSFPERESVDLLRALGVDLVIVHGDGYSGEHREALENALENNPELVLVQRFGGDSVYRIKREIGAQPQAKIDVSLPKVVACKQLVGIPVIVKNLGERALFFSPTEKLFTVARWSGGQSLEEHVWTHLPLVVPAGRAQQVFAKLSSPVEMGKYFLELKIKMGGAKGETSSPVEVVSSLPDTLGKTGHLAVVGPCKLPEQVAPGSTFEFSCEVRNVGHSVWLAQTPSSPVRGGVSLGIRRWRHVDGGDAVAANGQPLEARAHLAQALWPGQFAILAGKAQAPSTPGIYTVKLDMVSEWVSWFEDIKASSAREVQVVVK
ncbi:glycosyltransferase family protein [Candidatus Methylacidithermus pantelleriae]|nr:hypothetical protein [Candidatus Methylacidithermus pantelleriae]